jgi:hypothetical protein
MKTTIKEVVEAAKKNGFPWEPGGRWDADPSVKRTGYCILEQAIINLTEPTKYPEWAALLRAFADQGIDLWPVIDFNDQGAGTYEQVVEKLEEVLKDFDPDMTIEFESEFI